MDFVKQYLTQSISNAAENLRLNSNQIETMALLKELILKSDNLENDLTKMKKITEFSTLGIKLYDIYSFIRENTIDISTVSEKFKQHSQQLVKDINLILYKAEQTDFKNLFEKIKHEEKIEIAELVEDKTEDEKEVPEEEKIKENSSFTVFEETILKPIKSVDSFLNRLSTEEKLPDNIDEFIETMKINSDLSKKNGFEILSGMHTIVSDSLSLIKEGNLIADKENIEAMRACLIVIAAVVRGKEVNISDYLNKAESFSKKIISLKIKE